MMKSLLLCALLLLLIACAKPPKLATGLDITRQSDGLILVKLKIANTESRVTVPIALELTGQAELNGKWDKPSTLLHPAAFVLNKKEERDITKLWRVQAEAVRTTLVVKEQETGNLLRTQKAEKSFSGGDAPPTAPPPAR
ncbi:MAG TPA: hypothetical protein VMB25_19940 [Bryobacteraceae bacterium]|nr:hypothetical protein [Bryobacteraceae bacterium]